MIVVVVLVERSSDVVWKSWTHPEHIKNWNIPFDDWYCPGVENDVMDGGTFCFRMEKKDGSEGFDHKGKYDKVIPGEMIAYTLNDGRKSIIEFQQIDNNTIVRESFEPEATTPEEEQRTFCEAVLNRFKNYTESISINKKV